LENPEVKIYHIFEQAEANLAVSEMQDMPMELLVALPKQTWRRAFWYEGR
jgi:hypothetical protein